MKNVFPILALLLAAILVSIYSSSCGFINDPVAFVSATPPTGSTLQQNATITLTFDAEPTGLKVSGGTAIISGRNAIISGPFTPGKLALTLTWDDGTHVLNYTVEGEANEGEANSNNTAATSKPEDPPLSRPAIGEVLIYIGEVWWITEEDAAAEAQTTQRLLDAKAIENKITNSTNVVRQWMLQTIEDEVVDVAIFYGPIPTTIYAAGNVQPNGSVVEEWIETSDGNTLLNQADWFGYWADGDINFVHDDNGLNEKLLGVQNGPDFLENIMDIPGISMAGNNLLMKVTNTGAALTPSLVNFRSDRPFRLNQLQGAWFAEAVFASNTGDASATRADPVIVRDGNRGRIAIAHQTHFENNPKGKVAAEIIINYLQNN